MVLEAQGRQNVVEFFRLDHDLPGFASFPGPHYPSPLQHVDQSSCPSVAHAEPPLQHRHGGAARFDQQPIEAQAMVSVCLEAFRITGDKRWNKEARRAFEWFLGRNDLKLPLYDATTGGCRDGLHPDRTNQNQGAESTLAFLQSLLELRLAEQTHISMEALLKRTISI